MKALFCFAESWLKEIWAQRFAIQVAAGSPQNAGRMHEEANSWQPTG